MAKSGCYTAKVAITQKWLLHSKKVVICTRMPITNSLLSTFECAIIYELWGTLMCWVSLEGSAGVRSVAEWGTFVKSGFPCPGWALAGLGFGVGAVWVEGVSWCIRVVLGLLVCLTRFGQPQSLGLVWHGLHSGWGLGGLACFSALLLVGQWHLFL